MQELYIFLLVAHHGYVCFKISSVHRMMFVALEEKLQEERQLHVRSMDSLRQLALPQQEDEASHALDKRAAVGTLSDLLRQSQTEISRLLVRLLLLRGENNPYS